MDLRGVRKAWDGLTTPGFTFRSKQVVVRDSGDLEMLDLHGELVLRDGYKLAVRLDRFRGPSHHRWAGGAPG